MAHTIKLVQTRPNADVDFHTGGDEFLKLKADMKESGTILSEEGSNDETGLIRTWSITFDTENSADVFFGDPIMQEYDRERLTYNSLNLIVENY
jgi:hypothetical protein